MPLSEHTKEWRRKRYADRREKMLQILGPRCVKCGQDNKDILEIDHIDATKKSFGISEAGWCRKWDAILVELKKCQVLCNPCHTTKTIADTGNVDARGTHGTLSSYRYCHCAVCRAAKNEYCKAYKHRTGRALRNQPRTGLVHGTANAYRYYACRCDVCRLAHNKRCLAYYHRKRAPIV
jgi:hypothetical protein